MSWSRALPWQVERHHVGQQDRVGDAVGDVEMAAEREGQAMHRAQAGVREADAGVMLAIIVWYRAFLSVPSRTLAADTSGAA